MQNVIDEIKHRLDDLVFTMQRLVPNARIGAVAYRDRDDGKTATAPGRARTSSSSGPTSPSREAR